MRINRAANRLCMAAVLISGLLLSSCTFDFTVDSADESLTEESSQIQTVQTTPVLTFETDSVQIETPEPYQTTLSAQYFLDGLDDRAKTVYRELYEGIFNYSPTIEITHGVIRGESFNDFLTLVLTTSVTTAVMESDYQMYVDDEGFVTKIELSYAQDSSVGAQQYYSLMEKARQIADLAEEKESDYEKIKLIHDEIIKGCDYDADADFAGTAYGSLCEGKGLCEGYSKAFTLLCDLIGIQSVPVTGTAVDEDGLVQSHIWNKVLCDGVWYNVDCTWDDPTGIDDSDYVRYDYFLVCDADMAQTHTEDTNEFMPATVAWDASGTYFVREGLTVDYYTDVYAVFTEEVRKCFDGENPDKIIRFRCCDEQVLQYVKNTLFSTDYSGEEKGIYQILTGFMDSGEQIKYLMSENDKLNIINIRLKTDY